LGLQFGTGHAGLDGSDDALDLPSDAVEFAPRGCHPLALLNTLTVLFLPEAFAKLRERIVGEESVAHRAQNATLEFQPRDGPRVGTGATLLVVEAAKRVAARQVVARPAGPA